jgi:beta-1,4-N-acetylglucosaminyltransferase
MIFLTIGTQYPFERLVRAVDEACGQGVFGEELFGQIGRSSYQPRHFACAESLKGGEFEDYMNRSTAIIGHAGVGTISTAMKHNKPLLAMPRLARYGEHVNDHQVALAQKFEYAGHILVAYSQQEFAKKASQLRDFVPRRRKCQRQTVIRRIEDFLAQVQAASNHRV